MKKAIMIPNLATLSILMYYAVAKGLDIFIAVALVTSVISNILNIWVVIKK